MYAKDPGWKAVQSFLPPEYRLTDQNLPRESYALLEGGCRIHVDHYLPENPKARVFLFYGVGGNGRLLSPVALSLIRHGCEVLCPDLPLYGYSDHRGMVTYDKWVSCAVDFIRKEQKDDLPLFLFGLSAGGMLAYQVACEIKHVAGIMATCILDQRIAEVTRLTAANQMMGKMGKRFLNRFHKPLAGFHFPMRFAANMKKIANEPMLTRLLMKDKRSSGASVPVAFLHSMMHPVIKIEPEDFDLCPFLLVHPEKDRWTDVRLSRLFYDRLACHKRLCMLPGAGHFPIEEKGMAMLEQVCAAFIACNEK